MQGINKKIYLIGAGPGDPELITIKAIKAMEKSQVILYDQLVNPQILEYANPAAKLIYVGKKKGAHSVPQDEINRMLAKEAQNSPFVARLKGGDPFIFGRGGEEVEFLTALGFDVEVIPGVTTASGAGSHILLPLTHRKYSSEVILITGHKKKDGDYSAFSSYDLGNRTMIIYMGLTALNDIRAEMCKRPENCNIPVAVIENATMPSERVVRGTLKTIPSIVEKENIQAPALIIIGEIVKFMDDLERLKMAKIN